MSDMTTRPSLVTEDFKAQLVAEKEASVARRAAIRAKAKANGVTVQSKTRRLASEVVRSFSRTQVQRWISQVLPDENEVAAIAEALAEVAEWQTLVDAASDATRPQLQKSLATAVKLHRVMVEKSAGGGSLEPSELSNMRVLLIALVKSGKVSQIAMAKLCESALEVLPAVAVQK